jgi:hypothetical protein
MRPSSLKKFIILLYNDNYQLQTISNWLYTIFFFPFYAVFFLVTIKGFKCWRDYFGSLLMNRIMKTKLQRSLFLQEHGLLQTSIVSSLLLLSVFFFELILKRDMLVQSCHFYSKMCTQLRTHSKKKTKERNSKNILIDGMSGRLVFLDILQHESLHFT